MKHKLKAKNGQKYCHQCKLWKDLGQFYKPAGRAPHSPCLECRKHSKTAKIWRKDGSSELKDHIRALRIKAAYGLEIEGFNSLLESQNGLCDICKAPISFSSENKKFRPHVDHSHVTGVVRGLLCLTCNTGIGMFEDSSSLLKAASEYLMRHPDPPVGQQDIIEAVSVSTDNETIH